jgi:hypothetical protein
MSFRRKGMETNKAVVKTIGGGMVIVGTRLIQVGMVDPEPTSKIVLVVTGGVVSVVGALVAMA